MKLNKEIFEKRVIEAFPPVYQTTVSVVQGVAFGILIFNTFKFLEIYGIQILPYSLISFLIFVTISYEYIYFLSIFRWSIKIFDIIIPFVIGICEVTPMYLIDNNNKWWLFTGVLCLLGALAYLNSIRNCESDMFEDRYHELYVKLKNDLWRCTIYSILSAIVCFVGFWLSNKYEYQPNDLHISEIILLIILLVIIFKLLIGNEKFLNEMYKGFGIER